MASGKSRLIQVGSKLLLLGVSLVIALLLGEGLVRLFAPQDLETSLSWYEGHPVYRFRHRSNLDRRAKWSTYYHLQTNARGLRGKRDYTYDPGDHWRILVHGDSFTFGNGMAEDSIFVRVTEKELQGRGHADAQVINMGVSASGSSLEYLYYREEGRKYQPDVVVVAVFLGNDFIDDYRDGAFKLENGELVYQPFELSYLKRLTNIGIYQFFAARSHLLVFLRTHLIELPGQQEQVDTYTDYERFEEMYALNEKVLLAFGGDIEEGGAKAVFLLLPSPWQLLKAHALSVEGDYFPQAEAYRTSLLQTCQAHSLDCIDVMPTMIEATEEPWSLFIHDADGQPDFHYNAVGHALVADKLADRLQQILGEQGVSVSLAQQTEPIN